jgi:hypothetical protein
MNPPSGEATAQVRMSEINAARRAKCRLRPAIVNFERKFMRGLLQHTPVIVKATA